MAFNGTKGRLEQHCHESSYVSSDGSPQGKSVSEGSKILVYPHFKSPYEIEVEQGHGDHGGGDIIMLNDIFGNAAPDPLKRNADYVQGAYSILTGIAANKSMETGKDIIISDLVKGLPEPDFIPMPGEDEHIPYVKNTKRMCGGVVSEANVIMNLAAPQ